MKECSPVPQTKPGPQIAVLTFLIVCHVNFLRFSLAALGRALLSTPYNMQDSLVLRGKGHNRKPKFLLMDAAVWGCSTFLVPFEKASALLLSQLLIACCRDSLLQLASQTFTFVLWTQLENIQGELGALESFWTHKMQLPFYQTNMY